MVKKDEEDLSGSEFILGIFMTLKPAPHQSRLFSWALQPAAADHHSFFKVLAKKAKHRDDHGLEEPLKLSKKFQQVIYTPLQTAAAADVDAARSTVLDSTPP